LHERVAELGRLDWLRDEMEQWQSQVEQFEYSERWRRMAGISGLPPQSLAIARALWQWRDAEAKQQDRPPRRILRDDLIAELSKRGSADVASVEAIRGMNYRDKQRYLEPIAACIQNALDLPDSHLPVSPRRKSSRPRLTLLGQFLATALSSVCHAQHVAPSLVGSVDDVRDLIAYRLRLDGFGDGPPPALTRGWRSEVVGQTIQEVLAGKLAIRVADPLADHPLHFEPVGK
jgi:ribonuclease D